MSLDSLKLLETKINEFVERHEGIRRERDQLREQLRDRDKKLSDALSQQKRFEKERGELRSRLERILGRLNAVDVP